MTESEKAIQNRTLLEATRLGARVFRNQVGQYQLMDGRYLRSGLCVGSSDLIGWCPYMVKPQDVGRQVALFLAVEVKTLTGRVTPEQQAFINAVAAAGGIAGVVRDPLDLRSLFGKIERT